jgi:hypothetical protein
MANIFKNYPLVNYRFGTSPDLSLFENITTYISILDNMREDLVFYETDFINDFERPDTLSFKLYGSTTYYWTFYYLNDDIRESGWPLAELELKEKLKSDYPHRTVTTADPLASTIRVGDTVEGKTSGSVGTVVKKFIDLGQVVIRSPDNFGQSELIVPFDASGGERTADTIQVHSEVEQYNSVHHYENSSGEYVDLPLNVAGAADVTDIGGLTPITYSDRVYAKNNDLRDLKVLKPNVVVQVQAEYNKLLRT